MRRKLVLRLSHVGAFSKKFFAMKVHVRRQSGTRESKSPFSYRPPEGRTCMQEVKTVIAMPKFDSNKTSFTTEGDYTKVIISPEVFSGLREYVATISSLYRDNNPFHNFEHACHVTMSKAAKTY